MISHVWSAGRWFKTLALLYYLNSGIALAASVATWILGTAFAVVVWGHGDYQSLGGNSRLVMPIQWAPIAVYLVFILFGHVVCPWVNQSWWLDKFCIHQSRPDLKAHGVTSLPEVVAYAKRMVVLWDASYFTRLWCNDELATFVAAHGGAEGIDFMPLWLAPWIISSMLCDCFSALIFGYTVIFIPMTGQWAAEHQLPPDLAILVTFTVGISLATGLAYAPASIGMYFCFRQKLKNHDLMVRQLSAYSLSEARCTVESDRKWVEEHVSQLFSQADGGDPIAAFESYMRNDIKDSLASHLGGATGLKLSHCLLAILPALFGTAVNDLSCDCQDCHVTYKVEGASSINEWMLANTFLFAGTFLLFGPPVFCHMLKMIHWSGAFMRDGTRKDAVGLAICLTGYFEMGFAGGFYCGLAKNAIAFPGPKWKVGLLVYMALFAYLHYKLFWQGKAGAKAEADSRYGFLKPERVAMMPSQATENSLGHEGN
mmetsp:Transcript_96014/g.298995  ORF Transcript_96014/g.298995 Transcript_96014/m.298995 type:complete len:484 (+) Transcript_96014:233-1684(+)